MQFYSEKLNQLFKTVEELENAELELQKKNEEKAEKERAEKEKKAKLEAERKARAKEVEDAFVAASEAQKKADELLAKFCEDYQSFHFTFKGPNVFPLRNSLVDFMLNSKF